MDLVENWNDIKDLFRESFKSCFHFAIATVDADGAPHVTPIGSLLLTSPGRGIYFEKFTRNMPHNLSNNRQLCILAVNSHRWFWLKSIFRGKFSTLPAIRLHGIAGDLRPATAREKALWQKRIWPARFTKGYALMWKSMSMVREIEFTRVETVNIGQMTKYTLQI